MEQFLEPQSKKQQSAREYVILHIRKKKVQENRHVLAHLRKEYKKDKLRNNGISYLYQVGRQEEGRNGEWGTWQWGSRLDLLYSSEPWSHSNSPQTLPHQTTK